MWKYKNKQCNKENTSAGTQVLRAGTGEVCGQTPENQGLKGDADF
ncbi:hypothetical protein BH10CYA1_BH10CYA1_63930 [soil metagenome]